MTKHFTLSILLALTAAPAAQADPCAALAQFFVRVVDASGAEYDGAVLKKQAAVMTQDKQACAEAVAVMADSGTYTHAVGAPLSPLENYLVKDARFAVDVVGKGNTVKSIKFDIDAVGVLRRRPTR
ncbi:MAG: hypothetical protein AAFZ99_19080 [Pseudomonadota bacterium]